MDLKGKRAFITGGAKRLGREVALYLVHNGCQTIVHYNSSAEEAVTLQKEIECTLFQADFSTTPIRDLQARLQSEVGSVDILINNASAFTKSRWDTVDERLWDRELAVNLKVPFFLAQFFGKTMKQQNAGKIVNISDVAAQRAYLNYLPYSVAKAGVISITSALARALAPHVQVNSIAPGTILFPEHIDSNVRENLVSKIPGRRTGTVREFVQAVDFLLTGPDFITGQTLILDGGRTLTW